MLKLSRKISFLLVLSTLIFTSEAVAEIGAVPEIDGHRNIVYTTVGFDFSVATVGLGYGRALPIQPLHRAIVVLTDLTLPMAQPDFQDFRARLAVRMNAVRIRGFALPIHFGLLVRGTENTAFQAVGIGTELGIMPGYYAGRWFVAAEMYWDHQWSTHLKHTEQFRQYTYPGVRDGWYGNTGFTMRYGARVGGMPWHRLELMLRGGYEQQGEFDAVVPPFYLILTLDFRI